MSDAIKHECGIALVRLKKPLEFYLEKYGTAFYGLSKLHLLMEKQSKSISTWIKKKKNTTYISIDEQLKSCKFKNAWF